MLKPDLDLAIRRAINTSAISKIATLLVQILALPLALSAVGSERFGVYVMVTGLLSWLSLSSSGLFPGLTREVAKHSTNISHIKQLFKHALILVLGLSTLLTIVFFAALTYIPIEKIFGTHFIPYSAEAKLASIAALICILLQVIGGAAEAVRTGMQQQHINNLWGVFGNLLSIPLLLLCALTVPEIYFLVIATHGALALSKILNLLHLKLFFNSQKNSTSKSIDLKLFKLLLGTGIILLIGQVATLMTQQGSAFIVGYISGPVAVADFSVMLRITVIAGGMVVMVTQPLGAAITASLAKNDHVWVFSKAYRMGKFVIAYAIISGLIIAIFGPHIVNLWLSNEIKPQIELFWLTGLYFSIAVWNHTHYITLIAMGETLFPTLVLLAESATMVLLAVLITPLLGASGGMIALIIAGISISGIINHKKLRMLTRNLSKA